MQQVLAVRLQASGPWAAIGACQDSRSSGVSGGGSVWWVNLGSSCVCNDSRTPAPGTNFRFGSAVAISGGSRIIVGEENNFPIGAAYVYNVDSYCKLSFARRLVPTSTASVRFGCAVATLGDDRAVVGARGADFVYSANADSGSVFIFDLSNGQQTARLVPSDPYRCFWFGASVATMADVIWCGHALATLAQSI